MDRPIKTTSALAGVFGSTVSLAELAGDDSVEYQQTPPRAPPPQGNNQRVGDSLGRDSTSNSFVNLRGKLTSTGIPYSRPSTHGRSKLSGSHVPGFASSKEAVPISMVSIFPRLLILFVFGVAYGQVSVHLHDNHEAKQAIFGKSTHTSGTLLSVWGLLGIFIGVIFPLFDNYFPERQRQLSRGKGGHDWSSIIRALSAFMGVAYGIRKFAWTSTVQSAFYWGMVNPCLWYLLDATRNGFILSSSLAIFGTVVFAGVLPSHFPPFALNENYLSVVAWVASVLYCCSICFGNLGRRLLTIYE